MYIDYLSLLHFRSDTLICDRLIMNHAKSLRRWHIDMLKSQGSNGFSDERSGPRKADGGRSATTDTCYWQAKGVSIGGDGDRVGSAQSRLNAADIKLDQQRGLE